MADLVPLDANAGIVIVGAGIAGVRAALTLRECGFAGSIKLLSDEPETPYDRPPLSKAVLLDPEGEQHIGLDPNGELAAAGVELVLSARCVEIDRANGRVILESGAALDYDRLILATGSSVRTIATLPPGATGVHYLRSLGDALTLRAALAAPRRVAVVGAGVIGLEVAASLSVLGHDVAVIDPASRVMSRSASPVVGAFLEQRHRAEGVKLHLETTIESISRDGAAFGLTLSNGQTLDADMVVVGVGVSPNSALGAACGLEVVPQGIVVDAQGRTSDPAIYAAGEVAFHVNVHLGRHDRQETWAHAAAHGEHVAHAIMGREDGYGELSSYWSDQYDVNLQVVGDPIAGHDVVRGDLSTGQGVVFHLAEGRMVGVSAINSPRDLRVARKLLGGTISDPEQLSDPGFDLKSADVS